ncbi:MAG TPA: cytochrome c3 family protein [Usitatibacter sp.]|nr:cytochrome c3 family protein [Usitatibacter sp.]
MAQVFSERAVLLLKLAGLACVGLAATASVVAYQHLQGPYSQAEAPAQPVPFSHKHHVGDDGIDCRYCHASVETASFAGIPSTHVCMTCHSQLFTDAPMLAPVRESAARGEPLHWTRVHRLPDFVYFDHSIHVKKGVGCIECHGRVDRMPLMRRVAPLTMQWCLECHRDPAPRLRDPAHVFDMTPTPAVRVAAGVPHEALATRRRLTDCSTCHR